VQLTRRRLLCYILHTESSRTNGLFHFLYISILQTVTEVGMSYVSSNFNQASSQGVNVSAVHPLEIWLHPLGICKTSKTTKLIRSELRDDNITKPIHENTNTHNYDCQTDRLPRKECDTILQYYSESVGVLVSAIVAIVHSSSGNHFVCSSPEASTNIATLPTYCGMCLAPSATAGKAGAA
jgi:hypothetical protein